MSASAAEEKLNVVERLQRVLLSGCSVRSWRLWQHKCDATAANNSELAVRTSNDRRMQDTSSDAHGPDTHNNTRDAVERWCELSVERASE